MTATAIRNSAGRASPSTALRASDGKLYPTIPEGVPDDIARDIAERRSRPTTEERNRRYARQRLMNQPVQRPDVGIHDAMFGGQGIAEGCGGCQRHVIAGANCPGRAPAADADLRGFVPDCHSLHDGDREAVQRAMDDRERLQASDFRLQEQKAKRSSEAPAVSAAPEA